MAKSIGFVGLGTMGAPMAGHLLASGVDLTVWSRSPGKADSLKSKGARLAPSLAALAAECEVVILCVNRTEDVQQCVAEMLPELRQGALVIDHSTISPEGARELAKELDERGKRFVDAPITGGSMGAKNGSLTIFLGGAQGACEDAATLIQPYTKRAERVGPSGAGQMAKMANQIAVAGALLGLCECLAFASQAGLDLAQMREMIGSGAAGSWAFENYGPKILARDWSPGFSVKNQRKDFAYCKEAADFLGASIPGTRLVDDLLRPLQEIGRGEDATAALFEVLDGSLGTT